MYLIFIMWLCYAQAPAAQPIWRPLFLESPRDRAVPTNDITDENVLSAVNFQRSRLRIPPCPPSSSCGS